MKSFHRGETWQVISLCQANLDICCVSESSVAFWKIYLIFSRRFRTVLIILLSACLKPDLYGMHRFVYLWGVYLTSSTLVISNPHTSPHTSLGEKSLLSNFPFLRVGARLELVAKATDKAWMCEANIFICTSYQKPTLSLPHRLTCPGTPGWVHICLKEGRFGVSRLPISRSWLGISWNYSCFFRGQRSVHLEETAALDGDSMVLPPSLWVPPTLLRSCF